MEMESSVMKRAISIKVTGSMACDMEQQSSRNRMVTSSQETSSKIVRTVMDKLTTLMASSSMESTWMDEGMVLAGCYSLKTRTESSTQETGRMECQVVAKDSTSTS